MVAPIVYSSTDPSAPVLSGTAGTLISVLDACLVNGYGAKPAAGWTKEFSGTNVAAYRMGTGGNAQRYYMRVENTGTVFALIAAFRTMTDVNTGTERTPAPSYYNSSTANMGDNGVALLVSHTATTQARPWRIYATPTMFYMFIQAASVPGQEYNYGVSHNPQMMFFGEYQYYGAGYDKNVVLSGSKLSGFLSGPASGSNCPGGRNGWDRGAYLVDAIFGPSRTQPVFFAALRYAADTAVSGMPPGGVGTTVSVVDGKIRLSPFEMFVNFPIPALIGRMPGLYHNLSNQVSLPGAILEGTGDLAGQKFVSEFAAGATGAGNSNDYFEFFINITDW
jgi:hypothetical protein